MPFEQEDGERREGLGATHGLEGWGMGEGSFTFTKCFFLIGFAGGTQQGGDFIYM